VPLLIPAVLTCLTDTNNLCSISARYVLGHMNVATDDAVTALTTALEHPEAQVRVAAAGALSRSRGPAQTAVPALVQLLSDPNADVRKEATNTLRDIAPDVLTNAPPHF
jgi:HEAT repeat protein